MFERVHFFSLSHRPESSTTRKRFPCGVNSFFHSERAVRPTKCTLAKLIATARDFESLPRPENPNTTAILKADPLPAPQSGTTEPGGGADCFHKPFSSTLHPELLSETSLVRGQYLHGKAPPPKYQQTCVPTSQQIFSALGPRASGKKHACNMYWLLFSLVMV